MDLPNGIVGTMTATPDYIPLVEGRQRITFFDGSWAVQRVDKKTCKFTYHLKGNLTGSNGIIRTVERGIILDAHIQNVAKLRAVFGTPG